MLCHQLVTWLLTKILSYRPWKAHCCQQWLRHCGRTMVPGKSRILKGVVWRQYNWNPFAYRSQKSQARISNTSHQMSGKKHKPSLEKFKTCTESRSTFPKPTPHKSPYCQRWNYPHRRISSVMRGRRRFSNLGRLCLRMRKSRFWGWMLWRNRRMSWIWLRGKR